MMLRRCWTGVLLAVVLAVPAGAEIIEQVLVKVNGEIVTLSDFEERVQGALLSQPELAALPDNSPAFAKAVADAAPRTILAAVDELLLLQRARDQGWALTDEAYTKIIEGIRADQGLEDEGAFKTALAAEGLTEAELRTDIERRMLIERVQTQEVLEKIDVTDGEILAYYQTHTSEFTTPAQVTLREILIPLPVSDRGINVAESDAARERAEAVRKRLLAGESFAQLAAEVSSAPSKSTGGLLGPIPLDQMAQIYQDMLAKMQVGDITDVVSTTAGFQILKLEERTETEIMPLAQARDAVSRRVAQQKSEGEMLRYLERLRAQATIKWRHEELRKAYEQALAARRASMGLSQPDPAP